MRWLCDVGAAHRPGILLVDTALVLVACVAWTVWDTPYGKGHESYQETQEELTKCSRQYAMPVLLATSWSPWNEGCSGKLAGPRAPSGALERGQSSAGPSSLSVTQGPS